MQLESRNDGSNEVRDTASIVCVVRDVVSVTTCGPDLGVLQALRRRKWLDQGGAGHGGEAGQGGGRGAGSASRGTNSPHNRGTDSPTGDEAADEAAEVRAAAEAEAEAAKEVEHLLGALSAFRRALHLAPGAAVTLAARAAACEASGGDDDVGRCSCQVASIKTRVETTPGFSD